ERHRPDARTHPDLLGQRRRLADHQVSAGQLVGRLEREEGAVLADPGLLHAKAIGDDDLLEILVVARLGDLVVAVAVGKDTDLHRWPLPAISKGRRGALALSSERPVPGDRPPLPFRPTPVQISPMGVQQVRLSETVRYLETEALDGLVAVNYGH